jgi:hypothetical protein
MARTEKPKETTTIVDVVPTTLKWRKIGGGSMRLKDPDRIIKPNETFRARRDEIPAAFMDTVVCLSSEEELVAVEKVVAKEKAAAEVSEEIYTIKKVSGSGANTKYNVINEAGKAFNEAPLSKKEATDLIAVLEA